MGRWRTFTCSWPALLCIGLVAGAVAQESPNLGVPADPEEVAAWDIDIGPDGAGLPPGAGTVAEGEAVYAIQCLTCHGPAGNGQLNDVLVGGHGSLTEPVPVRTIGSYWPYATTIFDYIRRSMPYLTPRTLSDDEIYALTAYLLFLNGIIVEDEVMNAQSLPAVVMPNRDSFILAYPPEGGAN